MTTSVYPVEQILRKGLRRLLIWAPLLVIVAFVIGAPPSDEGLYSYTLAHLAILQIITFAFAIEIGPLADLGWFESLRRPWLARVSAMVAAVVGFSALLTLASSAAARYDPSLQFLQLLSSLDIAWVVAGLYLGARALWGKRIAVVAGSLLLVACVVSIALYLDAVGFAADGGWLVDGAQMWRIVIPSDVMAAVITITTLLVAARRQSKEPKPAGA